MNEITLGMIIICFIAYCLMIAFIWYYMDASYRRTYLILNKEENKFLEWKHDRRLR